MKKFNNYLLMLTLFPNMAFALFCPTNFNVINIGEPIASVTQKCGMPANQSQKEAERPGPQEWTYFLTETVATNTTYQASGTLKMSIAFDKNDKAINISVNGIGVGASGICGRQIALGNSREQIKSACGRPAIVNKNISGDGNLSPNKTQTDHIVEYQYNTNPPTTLIFKNGKLFSVKN